MLISTRDCFNLSWKLCFELFTIFLDALLTFRQALYVTIDTLCQISILIQDARLFRAIKSVQRKTQIFQSIAEKTIDYKVTCQSKLRIPKNNSTM